MREIAPQLSERLVSRLRAEEPELVGVVLAGSWARGEADIYSDVDLVALTRGAPRREERAWLETLDDGRLLHVSVAGEAFDAIDTPEAPSWSLGFPTVDVQRWLWGTPEARAARGENPSERTPAGTSELEDFVELSLKVSRAVTSGDRLLLHWSARTLAEYAPGLLRALNPERIVRTPLEALTAARTLPHVPQHYRADFDLCWGLKGASDAGRAAAAARLTQEVLAFVRVGTSSQAPDLESMHGHLSSGALDRYLDQQR